MKIRCRVSELIEVLYLARYITSVPIWHNNNGVLRIACRNSHKVKPKRWSGLFIKLRNNFRLSISRDFYCQASPDEWKLMVTRLSVKYILYIYVLIQGQIWYGTLCKPNRSKQSWNCISIQWGNQYTKITLPVPIGFPFNFHSNSFISREHIYHIVRGLTHSVNDY